MILRPGQRIAMLPGLGVTVTQGRATLHAGGEVAGWWSVAGKVCVAAYQPIGAADYATSKINLANPGTFDAADGAAYPALVANGWKSNGTTHYLTTGIEPADTWTMIMRTDGASGEFALAGAGLILSTGFSIGVNWFSVFRFTNGATATQNSFNRSAATVAVAGKTGYYYADFGSGTRAIAAGALVTGNIDICRVGTVYGNGIICALAIYSDTLNADEIGGVKTAINAL